MGAFWDETVGAGAGSAGRGNGAVEVGVDVEFDWCDVVGKLVVCRVHGDVAVVAGRDVCPVAGWYLPAFRLTILRSEYSKVV